MLPYAVLFISSAALVYLLAYPVRAVALRFGVVDHPEKRKMHQIPIPLLGGVAIFLSFAIVSTAVMARGSDDPRAFLGLMAGATIILALGVIDDVVGARAVVKFAVQTLAAVVVVAMGQRIELFTNPLGDSFHLGWLGGPVAVFWIVGVTNAVNLIDGLDGLAAGIGGIAALGLFAVALPGSPFVATLTIILAGAVLGFLPHNFYPSRQFLGDAGSMFIGFSLAVIGLHGSLKATTATMLFLPIIVLGVPIFDTLFAIFRRARKRVSPFKADREHIHHRLVRLGLRHRNVVLVMYFVCVYLALTAYSISQFPYQTAFLFLVLLTMGGIIGLRTLRFVEDRLKSDPVPQQPIVNRPSGRRVPREARSTNGRNGGGWLTSRFSTLICEVEGFRTGFGDAIDAAALCIDLRVLLTRRMQVHSIRAEPSGPGSLIVLVRCEPLKEPAKALVQNGLLWYLEEHRERFSDRADFPVIRWIRPDSIPKAATAERREPSPLGGSRAKLVGS